MHWITYVTRWLCLVIAEDTTMCLTTQPVETRCSPECAPLKCRQPSGQSVAATHAQSHAEHFVNNVMNVSSAPRSLPECVRISTLTQAPDARVRTTPTFKPYESGTYAQNAETDHGASEVCITELQRRVATLGMRQRLRAFDRSAKLSTAGSRVGHP